MINHYLKLFIITCGLVFIMVVFQHIYRSHTSPHAEFISPVNIPQNKLQQTILPRLESKTNNFKLTNTSSLITTIKAASDYDQASAYVILDLGSGEVLESKNLNQQLPIASLTKIMTAVVAQDLASPDEIFNVSDKAAAVEPTKLGIPAGQKLTLNEALHGLLLVSANDCAQIIAEGINQKYGADIFTAAMNQKALFLNLKNTSFVNPQGFDSDKQYSSVGDLAILTKYALTYPLFSQIVKKDYQFFPANDNHKQIDMYNWNGLLGVYPGAFGIKIGNTDQAAYTTIVGAQRGGEKLLVVLLGAPTIKKRDLWASELLDFGFNKTLGLAAVNVTEDQLQQKYVSWKYFN